MKKIGVLVFVALYLLGAYPLFAAEELFILGKPITAQSALGRHASAPLAAVLGDRTTQAVNQLILHADALTESTQEIALPLEQGLVVTASRFQTELTNDGMLTWHGRLPDMRTKNRRSAGNRQEAPVDELNAVTLVRHGDNIWGSIRYRGQFYQVTPLGGGEHVIVKVDETKYPDDLVVPGDQSGGLGGGGRCRAGLGKKRRQVEWMRKRWVLVALTAVSCVLYSSTASPISSVTLLIKSLGLLFVGCFLLKFGLMVQIDNFWVFCAFFLTLLIGEAVEE